MTLAQIERYCRSLPGVTRDVKWGEDIVFSIGAKMFAVTSDDAVRKAISFKVEDERFLELTDRPGFIPAPYLARARWVQVVDFRKVHEDELKALLARAYELVLAKLPKKMQAELSGAAPVAVRVKKAVAPEKQAVPKK